MDNSDQDLRQDLVDAFDGDDPGAEFDQRVLAEVEGGGGEHEISALDATPRRTGVWLLLTGVAAAAIRASIAASRSVTMSPLPGGRSSLPRDRNGAIDR